MAQNFTLSVLRMVVSVSIKQSGSKNIRPQSDFKLTRHSQRSFRSISSVTTEKFDQNRTILISSSNSNKTSDNFFRYFSVRSTENSENSQSFKLQMTTPHFIRQHKFNKWSLGLNVPQPVRHFSLTPSYSKAIRIDGKIIAQEIQDEIKAEVTALTEGGKRAPQLAVLLVGNDPASVIYVRNKAKAAEYTGISCDILRLPEKVTEQDVLKEIEFLNNHTDVDGILVQLPLPPHINERTVCDAVLPQKDVDGFNVLNVGRFCVDQRAFIPATPSGVLEIIKRLNIETFGKNAVVCGRSKNVGLPIALHLHSDGSGGNNAGDATTTICHRNTPPEQLKLFIKTADIIVTATGVPGLVTADMVKEGVIVIDVGITRILDSKGKAKLVGDVDYEGVSQKASYITPVPGGVGPVTVAMVIKNTLIAYKKEIDFGNTINLIGK